MKKKIRIIVLIVLGVALLMVTIHFAINGIPSLGAFNPHAR
jgi:hypothetical protein